MNKIDRYILGQILSVFTFFLFILTIVFWINRAISLFDKLISQGHSSSVLFKFALLSLPSTSTIVFPLACLAASIFVTNKLKNDTEIIILQNLGLSPWRIAKPFVLFGLVTMFGLGFITTLLVPSAAEELHKSQIELDSSVSARLLKEGKFIHPVKGITFYIKEIEQDGTLLNILVHDRRNNDEIISYTANLAFLAKKNEKTTLYMENGLIQTIRVDTQDLSTTKFESVVIDLSSAIEKKNIDKVYLSHVSTWLLMSDKKQVGIITQANKGLINLELHTRFHRSIFCFVAAILGFSCLLLGNFSRFGLSKQISLAIITIILIKILESYTTQLAVSNYLFWPTIYLPSLFGIFTAIIFLKFLQ